MAASGNVRYSQIRSGDRSGTGAKVATVTGTLTTGKQLEFDANGNVTASSSNIGGGGGGVVLPGGESLVVPVNGSFSNLNSPDTVTANTSSLFVASIATSENVKGRIKAIPTAPYTVEIGFVPQILGDNYRSCGLGLYDGTKVKMLVYVFSTAFKCVISNFTNVTTFSSETEYGVCDASSAVFFKLVDDNTNWKWYWGPSLSDMQLLRTEARNTFLTATHVGMVVNNNNASGQAAAQFIHYREY